MHGEWAQAERDRLEQQRLAVQHDLVDARLRTGESGGLVAELAARTAQHPLDERVAGQYLLALHRAGRTNDALEHYRLTRARLIEDLGVEPGTALQRLHEQVLAVDTALAPRPTGAAAVVPRQLRAAPAAFVGRHEELHRLDSLVEAARPSGAMTIAAITGAGGFGKTWLSLRWAYRHLDRFPDGQLFVDLGAFSPDGVPLAPAAALRGFLTTLGVEPAAVPPDVSDRAALFRSLTANKRVLVVLDNAIDTDQVVPLLPGGEACVVVVTSRNRLTGLVTGHGAHHLPLDVLSTGEARGLLAARLGRTRVDAERPAVDELISLCGGFPLALGIVASRAHTRTDLWLSALSAELRDLGLDALDDDEPAASLPTVLSWSRRTLTSDQAVAFTLLGIAPGPDINLPAAAALTGLPPDRTTTVLRGLERASLTTSNAQGRHRMHDLIRAHAADTAEHLVPGDERAAAWHRVVDYYLHTAHTADRLLDPHRAPIRLGSPAPGCRPHPLSDASAALTWFDAEHPCLLAAQRTAAAQSRHQTVWDFAWVLSTFQLRRRRLGDQFDVWTLALSAAEHLTDVTARMTAHRILGCTHSESGQHDEAIEHLRASLALAEHHHDRTNQAHTHLQLAQAWGHRTDDRLALRHATQALNLFRTLDHPTWEGDALNAVAWHAARLGDYRKAREHCRAALTVFSRHPDPISEAETLDTLGYTAHHTGQHHTAAEYYQQALALWRDNDVTDSVARTLTQLGDTYSVLGRADHAHAVWQEALEHYRRQRRHENTEHVQQRLDTLAYTTNTVLD
ncbi:BTAD domain-containing putative transcriptional regulator [Actinosynnema sp. NPDC023658]|uniref:ATP-binding protein n=1 Tax=Actinosynnema sp. NPDC023658 TaxID=3155465 RepID=UPI0033D69BC1